MIKKRQRVYGDKVSGIRSNICEASIVNCGYEKELCHFKVEKVHHFEFINPSFFKTTKDLLANATFSIIDVKSEEQPNWKIGAPTYIQWLNHLVYTLIPMMKNLLTRRQIQI